MSGHSKWSTIKRQKGAQDSKRSSLFTKMSRAISVAARAGNNPTTNLRLRLAIERAKEVNVPGETITRAIERGSAAENASTEELCYEAYGPGGAALLISAVTDSRNRTANEVRAILARHGGTMGASGSVRWLFVERCALTVPEEAWPAAPTELELALIDAGAEEMVRRDSMVAILAAPENLAGLETLLTEAGIGPVTTKIKLIARETVAPQPADAQRLAALIDELHAHDDLTSIETNAAPEENHHPRS